jgi:hypothetical protein
MTFSDIPLQPSPRTLRQFAAIFLVFFLAVGAHQYFARAHHTAGLVLGSLAVLVGTVGLIKPSVVHWIFVGWMVLAFPIGWLVSQFLLAVLFYLVLTPFAVLFRWRGRDLLGLKPAPGRPSFWLSKRTPEDVRSYLKQY